MADEAKAREIETAMSNGIRDGVTTYTHCLTNTHLYLFGQASESNSVAISFQMVKPVMTALDGQLLTER